MIARACEESGELLDHGGFAQLLDRVFVGDDRKHVLIEAMDHDSDYRLRYLRQIKFVITKCA